MKKDTIILERHPFLEEETEWWITFLGVLLAEKDFYPHIDNNFPNLKHYYRGENKSILFTEININHNWANKWNYSNTNTWGSYNNLLESQIVNILIHKNI